MLLGGFGFLSRLYGLAIDNLVEVEMVLADGKIVIVNEKEYPGKYSAHTTRSNSVLFICGRPLVGSSRCRSISWHCDQIQSQSIPCPCCLCREFTLVRRCLYSKEHNINYITKPFSPRYSSLFNKTLPRLRQTGTSRALRQRFFNRWPSRSRLPHRNPDVLRGT